MLRLIVKLRKQIIPKDYAKVEEKAQFHCCIPLVPLHLDTRAVLD